MAKKKLAICIILPENFHKFFERPTQMEIEWSFSCGSVLFCHISETLKGRIGP